jgi:hypothetical protein
MVTTKGKRQVQRYRLTKDALLALIDSEAMARMGMPGSDFIRAMEAGELPETAAKRDIEMLVRLLPRTRAKA